MTNTKQKIRFLSSVDGLDGVLTTKYADIETITFLPDNIKAHDLDEIKNSGDLSLPSKETNIKKP